MKSPSHGSVLQVGYMIWSCKSCHDPISSVSTPLQAQIMAAGDSQSQKTSAEKSPTVKGAPAINTALAVEGCPTVEVAFAVKATPPVKSASAVERAPAGEGGPAVKERGCQASRCKTELARVHAFWANIVSIPL